jgi:hypothetical protein
MFEVTFWSASMMAIWRNPSATFEAKAASIDVIVSVDAYHYFGTDDLYLGYMTHFLKEGAQLAMVAPGLVSEIGSKIPEELIPFWAWDFCSFHSPAWWGDHWEKTGKVHVDVADAIEDGWKDWLRFSEIKLPLTTDRGKPRLMKWPCCGSIRVSTLASVGLLPRRRSFRETRSSTSIVAILDTIWCGDAEPCRSAIHWPSIVPNQGAQGLPGAFQHGRVAVSDQHRDRAVATPFFERPHANELLRLIGHLEEGRSPGSSDRTDQGRQRAERIPVKL